MPSVNRCFLNPDHAVLVLFSQIRFQRALLDGAQFNRQRDKVGSGLVLLKLRDGLNSLCHCVFDALQSGRGVVGFSAIFFNSFVSSPSLQIICIVHSTAEVLRVREESDSHNSQSASHKRGKFIGEEPSALTESGS